MKPKVTFLLLVILILDISHSFAQDKRALIIAVGKYNYSVTRWAPISSTSDIPLIKNALLQQGFGESNITVIQDQEATKAGIMMSFDKLLEQTKPGDVVLVHYSGHGQQIQDNDGDELDGYDEALIPIDAHLMFRKGVYEGENHLRDDEIGIFLDKIRQKAGEKGNILLVIDACHSGTSSRGEAIARGTDVPFSEPNYKPGERSATSEHYGLYVERKDFAPMACFYGAAAHQLNYEYRIDEKTSVGSLSYAFSKAFTEASATTTYKGLFDRIKVEMASIAPNQSPQSEGTMDQQILGGKILGVPNYSVVIKFFDDKNVTISKGTLHGVNPGSKVGFYNIDERDFASKAAKATGTIVLADLVSADVLLDKPLTEKDAKSSWVFVTEQNFGSMAVAIKTDIKTTSLAKAFKDKVDKMPMLSIKNDKYDLIIEENNQFTRGNNLLLSTIQDKELWSKPAGSKSDEELAQEIIQRIISYSQTRFLRNIEVEDYNLTTTLEIVPIEANRVGRRVVEVREIPLSERKDTSGTLVFQEGDFFKIKITNEGSQIVYFSVLDIQPDDQINVIIPQQGRVAAEYRLEPGKTYVSPPVELFPPYGSEVFKLIASDTPMDLGLVVTSRGSDNQHRGPGKNPFQELLVESYKSEETSTRGVVTHNIPAGAVHVKSILFTIKPKK
jgi:metacaspase-1